MRAKDIIRKVERILDLDGQISGLSEMASLYADQVKALVSRIGEVTDAIGARQYGDAVQKLSEEPDPVRGLGALRFPRLDEWLAFCETRKLPRPEFPPPEKIGGICDFLKSQQVTEPAQKLYRKAIRTKDAGLTVFSLRLLAETDKSRDWRGDLTQAEDNLKRELSRLLSEAEGRGERERACELADRLLDPRWGEPPSVEVTNRAKSAIASFESDEVAREQDEALDLLRLCQENWNAAKAGRILSYLDKLAASGTTVPTEDVEMVAASRAHCEADAKSAAFDAAWRVASEKLFIAVGHESPDEIRAAMAAVEFQDRPPDEEVYRKARLVILHDEAKRRQKMRIAATVVLAAVAALVAVSIALLRNHNFVRQCEEEAGNLELLVQRGEINALEDVLGKIKAAAPRVWDDPRLQKYEQRLGELRTEQTGLLAKAETAVAELESIYKVGWRKTEDAALAEKVSAAADLLGKVVYRGLSDRSSPVAGRFATLKASYDEYAAQRLAERVAEAEKFFPVLLAQMKGVGERLETQFLSGEITNAVETCEKAAKEWLSRYSDCSPNLAAQVEAADFTLAKKKAANGAALLSKLLEATDCDTVLKARRDLREFYAGYAKVRAMGDLGYGETEAEALLSDGPANLSDLADYASSFSGQPDETMLERVRDTISRADEYLGEAYGIRLASQTNYSGFAIGQYRNAKTATGYDVRGDIEWFKNGRVHKETSIKNATIPFEVEPLPSTEEIRELKMVASDVAASPIKLGGVLFEKLSAICVAAGKDGFTEAQRRFSWQKKSAKNKGGSDSAYRMTQLLNIYLNALRKLEMLPASDEMESIRSECRDLALPIDIADTEGGKIDGKYSWLFMEDRLVAKRNHDCALFLKRLADRGLAGRLKAYFSIAPGLKIIQALHVSFAGALAMEPVSGGTVVSPQCGENAVTLYALRVKGDKRILVPVLVPKDGVWSRTASAEKIGLSEGEPLFRFMAGVDARDPERELAETLKDTPADIRGEVFRVFHCE